MAANSINEVLSKKAADEARSREADLARYRDIIGRHDSLNDQDNKDLLTLVDRLGLNESAVLADVEAVKAAKKVGRTLEQIEKELPKLEKAHAAAKQAQRDNLTAEHEARKALDEKNQTFIRAYNAALGELGKARGQWETLMRLKRDNPRAFD